MDENIKHIYERLISASTQSQTANVSIIKDIEDARKFEHDSNSKEYLPLILAAQPKSITADTVGAYLYGCFQPAFAVEVACTPACAKGLKNPNLISCDIASYEKNATELIKLNDIMSEDANIFITAGTLLTDADKKLLFSQGVRVITLYYQYGTTINYVLGTSINITPVEQNVAQNNSSNPNWAWLWIFIFVVVILVLISVFTML